MKQSSHSRARLRWSSLLSFLGCIVLANTADAQGGTGYELVLDAAPSAYVGGPLDVHGTAYEVRSYATLAPLRNGAVVLELIQPARRIRGGVQPAHVIETLTVDTDGAGHFSGSLPMPNVEHGALTLHLEVGSTSSMRRRIPRPLPGSPEAGRPTRPDAPTRGFDFRVALTSPFTFDVRTDRQRYEPGEAAQLWSRFHRLDNGTPVANQEILIRVNGPRGAVVSEHRATTDPSGVVHQAIELDEAAIEGRYNVTVQAEGPRSARAVAAFVVGRRTVERLMAELEIDQVVVAPTGTLTGTVTVRTPSGTPVQGANVTIRSGETQLELVTGRDGTAAVRLQAPAYLQGDVAPQQVTAQAIHPAHGSALAAAGYLLSRVRWRVEIRAEGGGVVPEVDDQAYVLVTDPRGGEAPEGMRLTLKGDAVLGGEQSVELDNHGMATIRTRVADGSGTQMQEGSCAGQFASPVDVEFAARDDEPMLVAVSCIRVAPLARVYVRADSPLAVIGGQLRVSLGRHPSIRGQEILVKAIAEGRTLASAFTRGTSATLHLPPSFAGVVQVSAQALAPTNSRPAVSEPGSVALGIASFAAVLVRPDDAFSVELEPVRQRWQVRETAEIRLNTSGASPQAWAAYVVRDLAAHGGEIPWRVNWMRNALGEALSTGLGGPAEERLLRAALVAGLTPGGAMRLPAPLVPHPWDQGRHRSGLSLARDAVFRQSEIRGRGVGQLMLMLEQATGRAVLDPEHRAQIIRGRNFAPDAIQRLVDLRFINDAMARTLGGGRATIAMLREFQSGFGFDMVAARLARSQLVQLMAAVVGFSNPDDENAARASSGYEPSDWLSRMIELRVIGQNQLIDPWGHPFVMRSTAQPRFLLSVRAARHELVSAGPDGRFGTRDDIADPFARIIPAHTPYSVASGEDRIMRQLSMLSPGPRTLSAMAAAYAAVDLAVRDEQRQTVVTGLGSEGGRAFGSAFGAVAGGSLGDVPADATVETMPTSGTQASARRPERRSRGRDASAAEALAEDFEHDDGNADPSSDARNRRAGQAPGFAALSQIVRERFPATLMFEPLIPLDGQSTTLSIPLADALTTYRVETVAWSASGWLTSASADIQVDQDATIDAPVPPFASVGDMLRLPVRVTNRTGQPLEARILLTAEQITLGLPDAITVTIPPHDGILRTIEVRLPAVGEGHLKLEVSRPDGTPLDAVRRPLIVWPDARLVHVERELLALSDNEMTFEIPADASPRGPAGIWISSGAFLFGDPADYAPANLRAGLIEALGDQPVRESSLARAHAMLASDDRSERARLGGTPVQVAEALSILWGESAINDRVMTRGLRYISERLRSPDDVTEANVRFASELLIALAPATRSSDRPAVSPARNALVEALRQAAESAVGLSESPSAWAHAAFALALHHRNPRARELVRRAERHLIVVGDESFLDDTDNYGTDYGRILPSSWLAGAQLTLGRRTAAMSILRHLASLPGARVLPASTGGPPGTSAARDIPAPMPPTTTWPVASRLAATLTATLLSGGQARNAELQVDGVSITLAQGPGGVFGGQAPALNTPGSHTLRVTSGDVPSLVFVALRYGRPWDSTPMRTARIGVSIEGELGARDTRAGIAITLRNHEPHLINRPIVRIDLPSGSELEETARTLLESLSVAPPTMEGRTLRLALRPLAPGALVTLPLPLRWSLSGELRGLGVSVVEDGEAERATAVLPSRSVLIEDEGPQPDIPDPESVTPPAPPEPRPLPGPFERLSPVSRITGRSEVMA